MQLTMPRALPSQVTGPVVAVLARAGMTPNMLTVAQLIGGIIAAYVIAEGEHVAGGLILVLAATLDAFDGALARTTGKATTFGAVFDSVIDRLFEGAVFAGIVWYYMEQGQKPEVMAAFAAAVGSICVSYVRARAEGAGIDLYDGLFTRPVRIVALTGGLVASVLDIVVWVLAVATLLTVLHRLFAVWQKTHRASKAPLPPQDHLSVPDSKIASREVRFLNENGDQLVAKYGGRWIAVEGATVVASGAREMDAVRAARAAGGTGSFVVRVPSPDDPPSTGTAT